MDETNRKNLLNEIKKIRKEIFFDDTFLEEIIRECTTKQFSFESKNNKCKICDSGYITNKKKHINTKHHKSSKFFLII